MNKITLIGRVGRDPEVKNLDSGKVTKFSLAVTEKKNGNGEEHTEWFNIVAFSKYADVAEKYVRKGDRICVIGKFRAKEYTNGSGEVRHCSEVIVHDLELLGGNKQT